MHHEADISAPQQAEKEKNGFPGPFQLSKRPAYSGKPPGKGTEAFGGIGKALSLPYPSSLRLKKGWEFDFVFRTGGRHKNSLVRLLFVRSQDGSTKFGAVVGKKQGNACVRSRGKRLLREAARRLAPWVRPGNWFVLTLTQKGLSSNGKDVYYDLACLMKKKGFLADNWPGPLW